MTTRRDLLKSAALAAAAMPFLTTGAWAARLSPMNELRESAGIAGLPAPGAPDYWAQVRKQFMLRTDQVFFNTGTLGAMPRVVVARMTEHLHKAASNMAEWDYADDGDMMSGYFPYLEIREKVARLVGADAGEIALTENVTMAMSFVAMGLNLTKGDEVVTSDQEHSGGKSSWQVRQKRDGIVYREIPLPKPATSPGEIIDIVTKSFTPKTRVLMLSHVITGSGAILPVKELCEAARQRGIFTVLDGAQALGHIPLNIREIGCDAYVGCFHKWILGPAGTGFLFLRKEVAPEISTTLASSQWDDHKDEGFRFTQRGTGSLTLLHGLETALNFHNEIGHERILERVKFLGGYLRSELRKLPKVHIFSPSDEAMCAGITVYNIDGWTGPRLQELFWERDRLRPRSSSETHGLRHSTHIYNSVEEIDRCLKIIRELAV
ncbi:MAG: aminotransferase class V-fold PLP-dependent enzyme [Bacteroidales bacterium]